MALCGSTVPAHYALLILLSVLISSCICNQTHEIFTEATCHQRGATGECLTLTDVMRQRDQYLISNSALIFQPGDHVLQEEVFNLSMASNFSLHGCGGNGSAHCAVTITCNTSSLLFSDASIEIVSLRFNYCSISLHDTNATVQDSSFENGVERNGGALFIQNSYVHFNGENNFKNNTAELRGGAIYATLSEVWLSGHVVFMDNVAATGGAVYAHTSNHVTFHGDSTFVNNTAELYNGGAVQASDMNELSFIGNTTFTGNTANIDGGAVCVQRDNKVSFVGNSSFVDNMAGHGGAIEIAETNVVSFEGSTTFVSNFAEEGGAVYIGSENTLKLAGNITFADNTAQYTGGAMVTYKDNNVNFAGKSEFMSNKAEEGGALFADIHNSFLFEGSNRFWTNQADANGGAVASKVNNMLVFDGYNEFISNAANSYGGAVASYSDHNYWTFFKNTAFVANAASYGGAVCGLRFALMEFIGNSTFTNNTAELNGGAINVEDFSQMELIGNSIINSNEATQGGGVSLFLHSGIHIDGTATLSLNSAIFGGGAMFSDSSAIYVSSGGGLVGNIDVGVEGSDLYQDNRASDGGGLKGSFKVSGNLADFGGALAFIGINGGVLLISTGSTIVFDNNTASKRGGAVFTVDQFCPVDQDGRAPIEEVCFLQFCDGSYGTSSSCTSIIVDSADPSIDVNFVNNTAVQSGDIIYGGKLESCGSLLAGSIREPEADFPLSKVSSDPYKVCICENGLPMCHLPKTNVTVYPGQMLVTSVVAVGQYNGTVPSVIRAVTEGLMNSSNFPTTQPADNYKTCSELQYPLFQKTPLAQLKLYSDEPCSTSGHPHTFLISFNPCPVGFNLSEQGICVCDERFQQYWQNCTIHNLTITRHEGDSFWIGVRQDKVMLHPHCPFDYCAQHLASFQLNDTDSQCAAGRSGKLCGSCRPGYSLALGSSRCLSGCSNKYLVLLAAFAFAGVVLVAFLFLCHLTVADGTLGGLIFYANVLAINRTIFFPPGEQNILTIFIAWVNLDLGIETCFCKSLDVYTKTWLQFIFPFYIWLLVGVVVLLANKVSVIAKLIGSTNLIAVLATLFLLSYTKLLRAIMTAFSFTILEYLNDNSQYVWLYDGNIGYLDIHDPRHISLFVFSFLFFVFIFLPYTLLLLSGQWLQRKLWWLSPTKQLYIKLLLDAHYAQYKERHRYWIGMLLLFLFFLLFVATIINIRSPQDPFSKFLEVFLVVLLACCWSVRGIYKQWYLDALEASFHVNLLILVAGTYHIKECGGSQLALVYTSKCCYWHILPQFKFT